MATSPWCDCDGCAEFRAIHAGHCVELPPEQRAAKRTRDRDAQRRYDDTAAQPSLWRVA